MDHAQVGERMRVTYHRYNTSSHQLNVSTTLERVRQPRRETAQPFKPRPCNEPPTDGMRARAAVGYWGTKQVPHQRSRGPAQVLHTIPISLYPTPYTLYPYPPKQSQPPYMDRPSVPPSPPSEYAARTMPRCWRRH